MPLYSAPSCLKVFLFTCLIHLVGREIPNSVSNYLPSEEVLANNKVPLQVFLDTVCDLLIRGRCKYQHIMITGNANCGKTFLLNPLTLIFNIFL